MIFRRDSTRERTLTVPTAAAEKAPGLSGTVYALLTADSQGRRGVKVVNVSGETMVT